MRAGNTKVWIGKVLDLLESQWKNEEYPPLLGHQEALDGLILTVLSQHTNDKNRDIAFDRLKERYPIWEEVVNAGYGALEDSIRPAGLAPTKAKRILEILNIIYQDFGSYSMEGLKDKGRDMAREYLLSLPGVGEKTAACVLMFDLNLPAFPVDTHVARFCRRVGFVSEKMIAEDICFFMEKQVPPSRYLGGHVNIIEHGRAICKARLPLCEKCIVAELCRFRTSGTRKEG